MYPSLCPVEQLSGILLGPARALCDIRFHTDGAWAHSVCRCYYMTTKGGESTPLWAGRTHKVSGDGTSGLENHDSQGPDSVPAADCRIFSGGHREVPTNGQIS